MTDNTSDETAKVMIVLLADTDTPRPWAGCRMP